MHFSLSHHSAVYYSSKSQTCRELIYLVAVTVRRVEWAVPVCSGCSVGVPEWRLWPYEFCQPARILRKNCKCGSSTANDTLGGGIWVAVMCVVLCCVVLCCVALRCVVLCCVVLRCVALRCVVLCCVVLCCVALCCVVTVACVTEWWLRDCFVASVAEVDKKAQQRSRICVCVCVRAQEWSICLWLFAENWYTFVWTAVVNRGD